MSTRVLVLVEDDEDMRRLLRLVLQRDDRMEIVGEAASAEEAIEMAKTMDPGVIVLDHQLDGELTGLEAAPLFKQVAPNALILLFTAFDMASQAAESPYVDAYLRKDDFILLLPTVQRMLGLEPLAS